jgi:hypothetical protein
VKLDTDVRVEKRDLQLAGYRSGRTSISAFNLAEISKVFIVSLR